MSSLRLTAASILFLLSATLVATAQESIRYESEVQYALEKLVSGTSATAVTGGVRFTVTPLRTWKSVSGHYCREYRLTIKKPGAASVPSDGIRCRDPNGGWKVPLRK